MEYVWSDRNHDLVYDRADRTADQEITIGRPIANTEVYILDQFLQPAPIGVSGELYIGGYGLARGYRARPELTTDRFIPHPFSTEPLARLYRTGEWPVIAQMDVSCISVDWITKSRLEGSGSNWARSRSR